MVGCRCTDRVKLELDRGARHHGKRLMFTCVKRVVPVVDN